MRPLDALRNTIQAAIDRCPPSPSDFERGVDGGLKSALIYVGAFEDRHPYLNECRITACATHEAVTP